VLKSVPLKRPLLYKGEEDVQCLTLFRKIGLTDQRCSMAGILGSALYFLYVSPHRKLGSRNFFD